MTCWLAGYCAGDSACEKRLDRMILEATGEMRELKNTVTLDGPTCMCSYAIGGCPGENSFTGVRSGCGRCLRQGLTTRLSLRLCRGRLARRRWA